MKHNCNYCDETSNQNRDALVDIGWVFIDMKKPVQKYMQACFKSTCQDKMRAKVLELLTREKCNSQQLSG